ncbi:binding partner of ACD11 1-like isoform X2 [Nymphaea colorata]|nr:binding partner of ACD11 1-like isoform X2 [Nymphaea colorata]
MSSHIFAVEVTNLSPEATEKDLYDFFALCGKIEHVEIIRHGELATTGYVTFEDFHAMEMAVLLSGATILDQKVCIARWGDYDDSYSLWGGYSWSHDGDTISKATQESHFVATPTEAVTMAQEVVKTMLAKGYILGKDALAKAREFDESHKVSAAAAAKVCELSKRIGLTDRINAGVDTLKSVDERYNVSGITSTALAVTGRGVAATGRGVAAATNAVVKSSYFSASALWVSDALARASKAAAELGSHSSKK